MLVGRTARSRGPIRLGCPRRRVDLETNARKKMAASRTKAANLPGLLSEFMALVAKVVVMPSPAFFTSRPLPPEKDRGRVIKGPGSKDIVSLAARTAGSRGGGHGCS